MDLKVIENELKGYLDTLGYKLYHVSMDKVEGEKTLHVEIDAHLDLEAISELSRQVSDLLDKIDDTDEHYLLDVSTVGLERELYTLDDVKDALGSYIYVKLKKETDGIKEAYGYLDGLEDGVLEITYLVKNIKKHLRVTYDDIRYIRLAIDFKGVKK